AQVAQAFELIHRGVQAIASDLRITAHIAHAVTCQILKVFFTTWRRLATKAHPGALSCRTIGPGRRYDIDRESCGRRRDELSAIHEIWSFLNHTAENIPVQCSWHWYHVLMPGSIVVAFGSKCSPIGC